MSVPEFYSRDHWGDGFGRRIYKGRITTHSGRDINGHPEHAWVPALVGGTVSDVGFVSDIGFYVEIRVSASRWDTYCHVLPRVTEGATVATGDGICVIASDEDEHGAMWSGDHLHFMTATRPGAARTRSLAINPDPVIIAAISGGAGGGGVPVPVTPTRRNHMFIINMTSQTWRNGHWLVREGRLVSFEAAWDPWGSHLQTAGVWVFSPKDDVDFDKLVAVLTDPVTPSASAGDFSPIIDAVTASADRVIAEVPQAVRDELIAPDA